MYRWHLAVNNPVGGRGHRENQNFIYLLIMVVLRPMGLHCPGREQ